MSFLDDVVDLEKAYPRRMTDRTVIRDFDGFSGNYNVPVMHWTRREGEFEILSSL